LLQERQQQEQPQRKQPTVSPSGGSGGDPIERALAIAARYRGSTTAARPPKGDGGGALLNIDADRKEAARRQQPSSSEEGGCPNGNEHDGDGLIWPPEQETEQILVGEVLPPEDAPSFERFWEDCTEPRGPAGFAKAEWRKLSYRSMPSFRSQSPRSITASP
jgi:hypothetical protein